MDKLKYIKLENEDGSYSSSIALSADANNIETQNGASNLENDLNSISTNLNLKTSQIEYLEVKTDSLANGAPLVASSISGMIDTTRVYVNTIDGHWYWYNGNAWTDGGVYQSTGIDNDDLAIDGRNLSTSKLALYDGYEELKPITEEYTFEHGDLGGTVGNSIEFLVQQWRLITPQNNPITLGVGEDLIIKNMSNGDVSTRLFICDNNDNIISTTGWQQIDKYLHGRTDRRYYICLQITGHYNYTVTPADSAKIRIYKTSKTRQNYLHNLFDVNVLPFVADHSITNDSETRCLTDFINYDGKIKIKGINYDFMVLQYNKTTKEYLATLTNWISNILYYDFNPNYLYKIQFRKSNNANITPNEVINNVKIYPIEQTDSIINYNFSNMILNNHQGYSNEYTTGYNLANSYYESFKQGYKYAECDVKFTLDNIPVCSHDASFVSGGQTIIIAETNYDDLIQYDYFNGNHISSLDDVMANCKKYGLTLQLDALSGVWTDIQWTNLFKVINKYQMKDYVMYSAGNNTIISKVLSFDSKAKCIMNVTDVDNIQNNIITAHNNKNGKNKFILAINHELITPEELATLNENLEEDIYIGVWTIDDLTTLLNYLPYAYMITTNKIIPSDIINSYLI